MDKAIFIGGLVGLAWSLYSKDSSKMLTAGVGTFSVVLVSASVASMMKSPEESKQSLLTIVK